MFEAHAKFLREHKDLGVRVEGNCDERGSREYNLALAAPRGLDQARHDPAGGSFKTDRNRQLRRGEAQGRSAERGSLAKPPYRYRLRWHRFAAIASVSAAAGEDGVRVALPYWVRNRSRRPAWLRAGNSPAHRTGVSSS